MANINTDLAVKYPWFIAKNAHNQFTITLTQASAAFDLTGYAFSLIIRKIGKASSVVTLTESDGITNGATTGILTIQLTKAKAELLNGSYYYELIYTFDSLQYRALEGTANIVDQYNPDGTSSTDLSVTVNLSGTNVNAAVTIGSGSGGITTPDELIAILSESTTAETLAILDLLRPARYDDDTIVFYDDDTAVAYDNF